MCFQLQLVCNLSLWIRIFCTQTCPYTLLVQSWTPLEAIWKLYLCSSSMYVSIGDILARKKFLHHVGTQIAAFLAVILTLFLLCSSLKVVQRDLELKNQTDTRAVLQVLVVKHKKLSELQFHHKCYILITTTFYALSLFFLLSIMYTGNKSFFLK